MKVVALWLLFGATLAITAPPAGAQEVRQTGKPRADTVIRGSGERPARDADDDAPSVAARGGGSASNRVPTIDAKYNAGMAAIRDRNPGKAVELMKPVLADFERRYADEKRRIFCAMTPEQSTAYLADAARSKLAAVSIDAGWCRAQYVTGYALIDLQKLPEAQVAFERLVRFAPQNSRYLNELGYIYMKQKKWQDSLAAYRRSEAAADLTPDRAKEERCLALKGIGYDLVEIGDLNAAEAAYRKCLNIDPEDGDSPRELEYIEGQRKLTV